MVASLSLSLSLSVMRVAVSPVQSNYTAGDGAVFAGGRRPIRRLSVRKYLTQMKRPHLKYANALSLREREPAR